MLIKCPKVVLGLRMIDGILAISDETCSHQELVMDINKTFNEVLKLADADYIKWNCIQIVSGSSFSRIVDGHMTGGVFGVSLCKRSFGSFSVRGTLITADGGVSMNEAIDVINSSPGCKPWTLVRFALCRCEDEIDGFDKRVS